MNRHQGSVGAGFGPALLGLLVLGLGALPATIGRAAGQVRPAPRPITLVLVLDRSGSMTGRPMQATLAACRGALRRLRPTDRVGLVAFDTRAQLIMTPQVLGNGAAVARALGRIQPGGGTDFLEALALTVALFVPAVGPAGGRRHVIFLSDGQAPQRGVLDRVRTLRRVGATVSTVALGAGADRRFLARIAAVGGGRSYAVNPPSRLATTLLRELKQVGR